MDLQIINFETIDNTIDMGVIELSPQDLNRIEGGIAGIAGIGAGIGAVLALVQLYDWGYGYASKRLNGAK